LDHQRHHSSYAIQAEIAEVTQPILYIPTKDIQIEEVPPQMEPAPVQKHTDQEWQKRGDLPLREGKIKASWNPAIREEKGFQARTQAHLVSEESNIGPD
jgi:hypothetical protein